jgi:hypothetical protein
LGGLTIGIAIIVGCSRASILALTRVRNTKEIAHGLTVKGTTNTAALNTECINTIGANVLALWILTNSGNGKEQSKTRESLAELHGLALCLP